MVEKSFIKLNSGVWRESESDCLKVFSHGCCVYIVKMKSNLISNIGSVQAQIGCHQKMTQKSDGMRKMKTL